MSVAHFSIAPDAWQAVARQRHGSPELTQVIDSFAETVRSEPAAAASLPSEAALQGAMALLWSPAGRELLELLTRSLEAGEGVELIVPEEELTPQRAADLLGVSRQFVMQLIQAGSLAAQRLPASSHHRILLADVLELQRLRDGRRAAADDFAQALAEAGLDD